MALYFYQAYSKEGKRKTGYVDASSQQAAREQVNKMGLLVTSLELSKNKEQKVSFFRRLFQKRIGLKEKIFFTKQLAVLLKAGIPLVQALDLLSQQTEGRLKDVVIALRDSIEEGGSLAGGLEKYPKVFDNIYIQLVKAGEASGKLEIILERLTSYLERTDELRKKIRGALLLPTIQLVVIVLVVTGLLAFVVPTIAKTFQKQGANLPWPTRLLITLSSFVTSYYIVIGIVVATLAAGFYVWSKTQQGSYMLDKIKLKIPLVRYFARMGAVVQFSNTLGMLLEAGVNLSDALNIVTNIVDNKILTEKLIEARDKIIKQGKISQYLRETGLFPPVAIYLINTGEQSGQLDHMLLTVANYYEAELRDLSGSLAARLGPFMLIIMAAVVGFVILAIVLPMTQMGDIAAQKAGIKL